ncbi:MAG: bifunctional phosphoribosyl-AMP cyclohydrolase/phosphoribosyl-ATP diphosphatase HisIE [Bacteroidales bacterium]|jgi:phosphoribosyl-ATP pyrophosphohydrolase/phosphoribosyl-AMP cyclohydrolase|nr:bifunctional phosphoribosyl-AMP cyclohydrolase/phosphoribosyl-ATP diphosphatase HisIE [Bacteroidales bacterium]MDD2570358.1 bifunctional phosphoribosyl-AMP cyclohydrolase/phosphoribosyl-ATP diphosphatase HisIE [Bacteroidales bacterium]MDD2813462.1 bifunctional phosphoribosyl-AMP cyclohydrolase/phosphoribosyl-ATP diphosphatase HisIE [Bacteroidales bacterium]MDD3385127.1 bifunctional phosphoribosyl-AMP cyclohydrolase/phosphoribosyl-ATP diphosphatase HisIE [Bacteroidales bacterium]MDD3812606.1 
MSEKLDFKKENGLIPAIIQDDLTRKVLMLGYMSEESLKITRETGLVTFYSRSRQTLWTKGETSGNSLKVKKILVDCDRDTLLIMATPAGPVCHDGPDTCFNEINEPDILFLDYLQQLILQRKRELPEGSYTAELFRKGTAAMAQKTGEEAVELVIEAMGNNDAAFLDEAADLLFHYLVLLADRGLSLQDVTRTLYQRHQ